MRKEIKDLLKRADAVAQETAKNIQEIRQCLFDFWDLILEDEDLALID